MPNDFTKTLIEMARYWPGLYKCRADLLSTLFCTLGSGMTWQDGRVGKRKSRKQNEALFHEQQKDLGRLHEEMDRHFADLGVSLYDRAPFRPHRIRTDAEVEKVLQDCDRSSKIRTTDQRGESEDDEAEGSTEFYPLYETYANLCNVPLDVRPDWLAGVRECIEMIIKWDTPEQVEKAKKAQADLEDRFGPIGNWHKLKRRILPPPPTSDRRPGENAAILGPAGP